MSGISLKETVSGDIPTPGTDKVTFFFNGTNWVYKDDAGTVSNLGVAGVTSVGGLMGTITLQGDDGVAITNLTGNVLRFASNLVAGANVTLTPLTGGAVEISAGGGADLDTDATEGFLYVPSCAGTPTGTPVAVIGRSPVVVDSASNKLYFYSGGAWREAGA